MRIFFPFLLLNCIYLFSCKAVFKLESGQQAIELNRFSAAAEMLKAAYERENNPAEKRRLAEQIGDAYQAQAQYEAARDWYRKSLDMGSSLPVKFKFGLMQKACEQYEEAFRTFTSYQSEAAGGFEGKKQAEQCREAIDWKKDLSRWRVSPLSSCNSPVSDYGLMPMNQQWLFVSERPSAAGSLRNEWNGQLQTNLWLWNGSTVDSFPVPVNTADAEGQACLSPDGRELLFTRCPINDTRHEACDIMISRKEGDTWTTPERLELMDDSVNVGDPFITRDGKQLFFSARAPGGYGQTDLYISERNAGGWGVPKNLGTSVNTLYSERFPFVDEKGQLYFASDGWPGMGGLDIFKSAKTVKGWAAPQNLRHPINSGADDFGWVTSLYKPAGEKDTVLRAGYFSSNRRGGKGSDDIYRAEEIWRNTFQLNGLIVQKKYADTTKPETLLPGLMPLAKARIEIRLTGDTARVVLASDALGKFSCPLLEEKDYQIAVTRNGYFSGSATVSTRGKKHRDSTLITLYTEVELERIFPQREIVIPNIYYDYDKTTLRPESMVVLDSLFGFFLQNPDLTIEIGSHTDSRGSDAYNARLSQGRAQSVVDYLIAKGLPPNRLLAKGYGESKLTNRCANGVNCTEEEHQLNRRTTFRVVSQDFILESVE